MRTCKRKTFRSVSCVKKSKTASSREKPNHFLTRKIFGCKCTKSFSFLLPTGVLREGTTV